MKRREFLANSFAGVGAAGAAAFAFSAMGQQARADSHMSPGMPVGGAETLLVNLIDRLDRERFAPKLCCLKELGPFILKGLLRRVL